MRDGRQRVAYNQIDALKKGTKKDGGIRIQHAVTDPTPESTRPLKKLFGAQPARNGRVSRAPLRKKQTSKARRKSKKKDKTSIQVEEAKSGEEAKNLVIN